MKGDEFTLPAPPGGFVRRARCTAARTTSTIPACASFVLAIGLRADVESRRYVPVAPAHTRARGSPTHWIEVRNCGDAALDVRRLFWA